MIGFLGSLPDELGGLLNYRTTKNETYVIGLSAPTDPCSSTEGTNHFTRISHYIEWIKQHVGADLCLKNFVFI